MKRIFTLLLVLTLALCCQSALAEKLTPGEGYYYLDKDGVLWGWNSEGYSLCIEGREDFVQIPAKVMENVADVCSFSWSVLILDTQGQVWQKESGKPLEMVLTDITQIAIVNDTCFAIRSDGTLLAWGGSKTFSIGNGTTYASEPMEIMRDVVSITGSDGVYFAITSDGGLWGWGYNGSGNWDSGMLLTDQEECPLPVRLMDQITEVQLGVRYCAALDTNGTLWGWGKRLEQPLPAERAHDVAQYSTYPNGSLIAHRDGSVSNYSTLKGEAAVQGLQNIVEVQFYDNKCFALDRNGTLWSWQADITAEPLYNRHFGRGNIPGSELIVPAPILENVTCFNARMSAAVLSDGTLWAWSDWKTSSDGSDYDGFPYLLGHE